MTSGTFLEKYVLAPVRTRASTARISAEEVESWTRGRTFFFILGFGRSGTAFLADLLNQAPGACVVHEPVLEDFYAHMRAHYDPQAALAYMQGFRRKEIYARMRLANPAVYGEVNSALRCHAQAIMAAFPHATLLHLVRDGRDVLRSSMPRRTMTIRNPFSLSMHPTAADPWRPRWHEMDRFARICWYWQEENRRLRLALGKTVQFEKLLRDYDYFASEVLQPCAIHLDRAAWQAAVDVPKNATARHQMPKWEGWSPDQRSAFMEICGPEMTACGYEL